MARTESCWSLRPSMTCMLFMIMFCVVYFEVVDIPPSVGIRASTVTTSATPGGLDSTRVPMGAFQPSETTVDVQTLARPAFQAEPVYAKEEQKPAAPTRPASNGHIKKDLTATQRFFPTSASTTLEKPTVYPKIYVYEIYVDLKQFLAGASDYGITTKRQAEYPRDQGNPRLDTAYNELMRSSSQRTFDPAEADFYYVPLERAYWVGALIKARTCPPESPSSTLCQRFQKRYVKEMLKVGPFWEKRQARHIVPAANCPTRDKVIGSKHKWFPILYGGDTLQLCVNAERGTIDRKRSLQSIYYVHEDYGASKAMIFDKQYLAVFMGNVLPKSNRWWHLRRSLLDGMQHSDDCVGIELSAHVPPDQATVDRWMHVLPRARFSIIPPGDSLERNARDQAIANGVIPVYFDFRKGPQQQLPMSPPLNWDEFSVNFTLTLDEWPGNEKKGKYTDYWPRLYAHLQKLVSTGQADRLLAGVASVQKKLRWTDSGVLQLVFEMLKLRQKCKSSMSAAS